MGFKQAANDLASASFAQKLNEPSIGRAEDRLAMQRTQDKLQEVQVEQRKQDAQQQTAGRVGFANELMQKVAAGKDENIYGYAKQEAPKYGVTPSALSSFFNRNKLPFNETPQNIVPTKEEDKTKTNTGSSVKMFSYTPVWGRTESYV